MIQHFVSIVAALTLTVWATVLQQYPQFAVDTNVPLETTVTETIVPTLDPAPSPFDRTFGEILRTATSTTPTVDAPPKPVTTTTPPVPFTPLPVPVTPVVTTPTVPTAPTEPVVQVVEQNLSAEALLKASIVNIICLPGGGLKGSSGTGIMVDPRGIILTVAHVAQQFLLADYPTENAGKCYIRTGSPAKNAYTAELAYISPQWLEENPTTFLESRPKGTGENDYAFLAITGSLTSASLPSSFTYIPFAVQGTDVSIDDRVGVGSYAAEFLTSSEVRSSLYPTISFAPVDDIFTFGRSTEDVISVLAGSAAQEGSSGGAVINADKKLIGLISTRTSKADLSLRELQAISVDHIRRSFRSDTGSTLDAYLSGNSLSSLVNNFKNTAKELLDTMSQAIQDARN